MVVGDLEHDLHPRLEHHLVQEDNAKRPGLSLKEHHTEVVTTLHL